MKKVPIGVLVSGSGSNLQSLIDRIEEGSLDARIRIVISNNPDAFALKRCEKHGIPAAVIRHADYPDRESFDRKMAEVLHAHDVDLVVMAGFMRILSSWFLREFPLRIMNIHPALLPAFPGLHVQRQAILHGAKFSGCTVHFADEGVDTGPIIIQAVVPVLDSDTEETLAARILKEEHRIYPQAIQLYAEGRLRVTGRRVSVPDNPTPGAAAIHNPPLTGF
ncbi:MAG: phosphoribosylglycinamide formyltransferase [Deltaproteobacteria bacterium HGW-Deltaproteobacteria-19]|jgi:phosphoribosylglycinamide formyltransferase-1|nr:MAG: phosphoribosylglycinamide formyltransferase [Deltaproteobacteria bacterium HGW-Deltaproteobacteria-19]